MTINWFEGGRRIVSVIAGLIVIGAAYYALFGGNDYKVIVEASSPGERLHWTLKECPYPDVGKDWGGTVEFKPGTARRVTACFRAGSNGKIPYALGPTQTFMMKIRDKNFPISYSRMIYGEQFSDEVTAYVAARMSAFKFTEEEMRTIGGGQWKIGLARFCDRVEQALPWVAGSIIGLWIVAAGLGWMVRGFAGVPSGKDFKDDDRSQAARRNRASLEWIGTAIGAWALAGCAAWLVLKFLAPTSKGFSHVIGNIAYGIGTCVFAIIAILVFFGGGMAFEALVRLLLQREKPKRGKKEHSAILFGLANVAILITVSALLGSYTVLGQWFDDLYRWGFANGLQDGPELGLWCALLLWPLLPLWILTRRSRRNAAQ